MQVGSQTVQEALVHLAGADGCAMDAIVQLLILFQ
jgi:hypothetical protein